MIRLDPAVHGMGAPKGGRKQSSLAFPTRLNRIKPPEFELAKCNFPKFSTCILQLSTRGTDPETPIHPQTPTRLPSIDIPAPEHSDRDFF